MTGPPASPRSRLGDIVGFQIDRVAQAAEADADILRLENLDTDIPPPRAAIDATRAAIGQDDANSYLPFLGSAELRAAAAAHVGRLSGVPYDPDTQAIVTAGGTEGLFNALLALIEPGDEVLVTDPTYAGMLYRVRLAGGVARFAPFVVRDGGWALDLDRFHDAVTDRTRVIFLMNPSIPSGAVLTREDWEAISRVCDKRGIWLLYNAAMERILFDRRPCIHPASVGGLADHTITVGSVSKEYRMIGWRVGWVAGPRRIMNRIGLVSIYNVVTPVGIAQPGALAALVEPAGGGVAEAVAEWERRRDTVLAELRGLPVVRADGGWSLLVDTGALGYDAAEASARLLEHGRVAATPMTHWGRENAAQFVRLVFSNEPVERLRGLGERFRRALGC
ncbi:MAG: pyridoxal phosphate-dependent aminotransferase [Gemmatimonadetes bacterium]|nr:pyridoxal phosphate-dependent aminotransferase [Gemmatimonadota bacterium]MYE16421.1 pyridoxal phosphate-dependent aminotransferase [Gemmatimonadota bacterium]